MRFLIVDGNLAYSKMVQEFLETHVIEAVVDRAHNAAVLRRRLRDNRYDFILADIMSCMDAEELADTLKGLESPVIMWSWVEPSCYGAFVQGLHARCIQKPKYSESLAATLAPVLEVAH